ncbi:LEAF RUST 10 DISEASE-RESISTANCEUS RECEPTOR-LIKE PROTEIN KINASE-like 2.1 [Rutidosis leptorrhynchoides]|uniref:LEAF RUST 10 DISEASE-RESISTANCEUS RECEPTOR-LIKE PROTEIN KINASE-like 2.1 n=1 Tax=Rutidosis leptorrhynchoides TaxID=125765 RepID=UPI003A99C883
MVKEKELSSKAEKFVLKRLEEERNLAEKLNVRFSYRGFKDNTIADCMLKRNDDGMIRIEITLDNQSKRIVNLDQLFILGFFEWKSIARSVKSLQEWDLKQEVLRQSVKVRSKEATRKLIIGFVLTLVVTICRRRRLRETRKASNLQVETFIRDYGALALKRFKYSDIKKMTNMFVAKLGQGGYGSVYKGQFPDGQLVAVKLIKEAQGDGEDFINEVASIGRTSHVNIVTLLGFCIEGKKRALLYEFMPNGSLDKFLRGDGLHLDWNTLFEIAKGIARGLEYLHRGCNTRIVHFDIKPHNILLNKDFVPKISDFGLAKLCKTKESIVSVTGARGTAGYMAPEVFFKSLGGASHKSDVYSYGMMVLEMTGARKKNNAIGISTSEAYFPDWVYKQVESVVNLEDYGVITKEDNELARKMMIVSLWCIQSDPSDRPSIGKVVEMLDGSFVSLQVPPKCFWSSPSGPAQNYSPCSSSNERLLSVIEV